MIAILLAYTFECDTLRTYWILWHLQTFKVFLQLNLLGAKKLTISRNFSSPFLFKLKMGPLCFKPTCRICKNLPFHKKNLSFPYIAFYS